MLVVVEVYFLLAERTKQLLLKPVIYALLVELVATGQRLHHLTRLQVVEADCTGLFVVVQDHATARMFSRSLSTQFGSLTVRCRLQIGCGLTTFFFLLELEARN